MKILDSKLYIVLLQNVLFDLFFTAIRKVICLVKRTRCACFLLYWGLLGDFSSLPYHFHHEHLPLLLQGSCVEDGLTYRCECGLLYKGSLCDVFDPCLGEPCQHGGTCLNMVENCLDDQSTGILP